MTDATTYRSTPRRQLVSKSDTDLLNSTVNLQGNPNLNIPPDRAESNPNISVSGFIDESPYTGQGTQLQLQREGMETRNKIFMDCFQILKMKINEWEKSLKNRNVTSVEINQQFNSLSKAINDLSNQALLAKVSIPMCRDISSLADVIAQIK